MFHFKKSIYRIISLISTNEKDLDCMSIAFGSTAHYLLKLLIKVGNRLITYHITYFRYGQVVLHKQP
jgi:hypothetical protein